MNNGIDTLLVLEADHFLVRATCRHSVVGDKKALARIAAASTERGVHQVIIDIRSRRGAIRQMERYQLGDYLTTIWPRDVPLAVIARPEQLTPDPFFFHMLQQRGLTAKVFHTLDEARTWIEGEMRLSRELHARRRGPHAMPAGHGNQAEAKL